MPTYRVEVEKTESYTIEVQAENRDDAELIAMDKSGKMISVSQSSAEFPKVEVMVPDAERALLAYREAGTVGDDYETTIQDLITDLLHILKAKGEGTLSCQQVIGRAVNNFIQEI